MLSYTKTADTLFLQRPSFWDPFTIVVLTVTVLSLFDLSLRMAMFNGLNAEIPESYYHSGAAYIFICSALLGLRLWFRRAPLPPIRFAENYLELPGSLHGSAITKLPYGDVLSLHMGGSTQALRVFIESEMRVFSFEQKLFERPDGPQVLFKELEQRIRNLDDGAERLSAMRERESIARKVIDRRPWATHALLGVLVVIFLVQDAGATGDLLAPLNWGASNGLLIRSGEYFRIVSANLLHTNGVHILFNGVALFSLGAVVERFFGWQRFLVIYLGSGIASVLLSTMSLDYQTSLGASGCIFGVFGALLTINIHYRTHLPLGFRQPMRWWIFIVGINVALPILLPIIDMAGHIGGFVAGALIAIPFLQKKTDIKPEAPAGLAVQAIAAVLILTYVAGFGAALWRVGLRTDETTLQTIRQFMDHDGFIEAADPQTLNQFAWAVAINPQANDADLQAAVRTSRASLEHKPQTTWRTALLFFFFPWERDNQVFLEPQYKNQMTDTLATLYYRQHRFAEAITSQRQTLENAASTSTQSPMHKAVEQDTDTKAAQELYTVQLNAPLATQLLRFIEAAQASGATLPNVGDIDADTMGATVSIERPAGPPELVLNITDPKRWANGGVMYFAIRRGEQNFGVLQLGMGPNIESEQRYKPQGDLTFTKDTHLTPILIADDTTLQITPGLVRWRVFPRVPEFDGYP